MKRTKDNNTQWPSKGYHPSFNIPHFLKQNYAGLHLHWFHLRFYNYDSFGELVFCLTFCFFYNIHMRNVSKMIWNVIARISQSKYCIHSKQKKFSIKKIYLAVGHISTQYCYWPTSHIFKFYRQIICNTLLMLGCHLWHYSCATHFTWLYL